LLVEAGRTKYYFDMEYKPYFQPNRNGKVLVPGSKTFKDLLGQDNEVFADFLEKCTEWKPQNRLTPMGAVDHKWIKEALMEMNEKASFQ
jgi:serine/threonine protein kinase